MGVKLWWRWLQGGPDLWMHIWEIKYEMPTLVVGKLKLDLAPKGSNIWNLAAANKDLIRQHRFWEVRGGKITLFWEDYWQQREKLFSRLDLGEIFLFTNLLDTRLIQHY